MTPAEATLWLIASPFIIIGGGAILAVAIRAFSPEAQVQLYAPVKSWAGAHPLAFRTLLVLGGWALARIAGGVLSLVATVAVAVWFAVLIIRYWREPWVIPTLERAADLAIRFWAWFSAWRKGELFQWASGQRRTAEIAAEAESVARALAMDTPEADLQLAAQRHAFAQQIDALSALPARDYHQEMQLAHLGRMIKDIDAGRFGPTLVQRPMAELGPVGRPQGFFGPIAAAAGGNLWLAGVAVFAAILGFAGFQYARAEKLDDQLTDARGDLEMAERAIESERETNAALAANARAAAEQGRQTAETIQQERALRARADRERRRIQDAMEQARAGAPLDYGFGGVRNDGAGETGAADSPGPAAPGAG